MSGLLRVPGQAESYPHCPLRQWFEDCEGTSEAGLYVTSRTWGSTTSQAETLHSLDHSKVDLGELQSFLSRESGTWSDNHNNRQARWVHVIGPLGIEGNHDPYIEVLCNYLGVPSALLDTPRPLTVMSGASRLIDYGHLTYICLDWQFGPLHVFLRSNNEVVTICRNRPYKFIFMMTSPLHDEPNSLAYWYGANAATVLWRFMNLSTTYLFRRSEDNDPYGRIVYSKQADRKGLIGDMASWINDRPGQWADICARLLNRQGLPEKFDRHWLTDDIRTHFEQVSYWCTETVRNNNESLQQAGARVDRDHLAETRKAHELAAQQARITAAQAHSAVVLNVILATLTSITLISLPFTMITAYFGMNGFRDSADTITKFWIIVGPLTGFFIATGLAIAVLLTRFGATIHRLATKWLGPGQTAEAEEDARKDAVSAAKGVGGDLSRTHRRLILRQQADGIE